jgi:hypothetical protein
MKGILFALILCLSFAFANITPTLFEPTTMYGGETKDYNLVIANDFSYDANVYLDINLFNESGNWEGMEVTLPVTDFELKAYAQKPIPIIFKAQNNLAPEQYGFSLNATYYLSENQTPIRTERIFTGGGTNYIYKPIYQDKNVVIEVVKEVPKEVIKTVEVVKEVPSEPIIKWLPQTDTNNNNPITGLATAGQVDGNTIIIIAIICGAIGIILGYFIFKPKV